MTTTLARRLAIAALGLGFIGNWFLRADSWRLGFVLWVLGIAAVALAATPAPTDADPSRPREHRVLLASAAMIALLLVLRDAEMLYAVDLFALVVVGTLIAWRATGRPLSRLEPRDAVAGGIAAAATGVAGGLTLAFRDTAPTPMTDDRRRSLGAVAVGTVVAAPVLLVVASLLGEADPQFGAFLDAVGELLETSLIGHVLGISLAALAAAGALRGSLVPIAGSAIAAFPTPRIAFPAIAPLLGGLTLLMTTWIGLQVRTLFGGSAYVVETVGVTYAEYARRGFFELIVIAGIVLAVLLVADELLERPESKRRTSFHAFGWVLLGLVGLVLASATQRLALYLQFYGLTEDRVLALAVLVWVALVLAWFGWTVLRDLRSRFAPGVLVLSAVWLAALNLANPERRIVETNLRRAVAGQEFDTAYHVRLSGDALPALLDGADRLGPARAAELRQALQQEWGRRALDRADWRRWSLPFGRGVERTGR
jgi:hypothetical protein